MKLDLKKWKYWKIQRRHQLKRLMKDYDLNEYNSVLYTQRCYRDFCTITDFILESKKKRVKIYFHSRKTHDRNITIKDLEKYQRWFTELIKETG